MRYSNLEKWRESMKAHDHIRWAYQDDKLLDSILTQLKEYRAIQEPDSYIYILTNDSSVERDLRISNRIAKFLTDTDIFEGNTMRVCGDYCIIITQDLSKLSCQHSYNPAFAKSMRNLMKYIRKSIA
jgi:hypothetical protein